jgi:hypothetical protein
MATAVAAVCVILAAFICWGVGDALRGLTGTAGGGWATSIGIGVAAIVFSGGLLNLAHGAYGPALWVILVLALAVSLWRVRRLDLRGIDQRGWLEIAVAAVVIGAVMLFTTATQLPPRMFNFHDDFEKYFSHPVRMLATGTVASGPLSSMGSETLGAQAFLQGFVVAIFPIGYINGVDAVFGLFVLMILAASAGWQRFRWFPGAILGVILVAVINPQYVNVSALYIGGALMATAAMLVAEEREHGTASPVILGLIYAGLVVLKPIFAVFVACHLLLSIAPAKSEVGSGKQPLIWALRTTLWTAVGLAPWIALYVPDYLSRGMFAGQPSPQGSRGELNLLSTHTLLYGSSYADYSAVAALAGAAAILALVSWRRSASGNEKRIACGVFAAALAGVLSYLIVVVGLGPRLSGYETSLRFSIPFVLGPCVIAILMTAALAKLPRAISGSVPLLAGVIALVSFFPSAVSRYHEAVRFHSVIAFNPIEQYPDYLSYNEYWLSPAAKEYVRGFQDKVPPGEHLLVWINTPFLLDYKRNAVVDVDAAGIGSPWAHIPDGVHYVLWQYKGLGVRTSADYVGVMAGEGTRERTIAARALAFGELLMRLSSSSQVIASDDKFVLFRIPAARS